MGVFSSAHCVPMAQKVDAAKKFMWANVCVASAVFKDKNLHYVFRPQVHSDQFGEASCTFLNENAKAKLGMDPKDLKVAIIYEDGPYGSGVAAGNEATCKEFGMQVVLKEGYAATSPDLSSLVTKLRARARRRDPAHRLQPGHHAVPAPVARAGPEVQGADRPRRRLRPDRQADARPSATTSNYFYNVDPVAAQLLDPKTLKPGPGRPDPGDGQALQGRRQGRRGAAARLHGLQPDLDLPHRRAAARDQEVRRHRSGGAAQGRARHRHPGRRHHPGLRREVLPAGRRRWRGRTSAPRRW